MEPQPARSGLGYGMLMGGGIVLLLVVGVLIGILVARDGGDDQTAPTTSIVTSTTAPPTSTTTTTTTSTTTTTTSTVPAPTFADMFEANRAAVARVDVAGCEFGGQGTAFLIRDDAAVTAWHVVDGATQVALTIGDEVIDASVVGHDIDRDVALLQLDRPASDATVLEFSADLPRVGEEVAAMGHPRGLPLALTVGRVTSMNGTFDLGEPGFPIVVEDLIQTDAVVAPGNSGGPLMDADGEVIGVVVLRDGFGDGLMWASDIQASAPSVAGWLDEPDPVAGAFCVGGLDLDSEIEYLVGTDLDHPEIGPLQRTYAFYALGINSGRAEESFEILGPSLRTGTSASEWAAAQETSFLWNFWIRDVIDVTPDALDVRVAFTSTQAPEFGRVPGETCTRWDLVHRLVPGELRGEEFWLIDGVSVSPAGIHSCDAYIPEIARVEAFDAPPAGESVSVEADLSWGSVDRWTIELTPGRTYTFVLESIDMTFDPYLTLYGPAETILIANDDRGDGTLDSEIAGWVVDESGRYLVEARDLNDSAAGPYRLTVEDRG